MSFVAPAPEWLPLREGIFRFKKGDPDWIELVCKDLSREFPLTVSFRWPEVFVFEREPTPFSSHSEIGSPHGDVDPVCYKNRCHFDLEDEPRRLEAGRYGWATAAIK